MKKLLILSAVLILPVVCSAICPGGKVSKRKVASVISHYKNKTGVEVIDLGWLGTSLVKSVVRLADSDDKDTRQALAMMKGLKGISIMSYEESSPSLKAQINSHLETALKGSELLMEVKDEGNRMRIYGSTDEKTGKVGDLAVFAPDEGSFIFLSGSFNMDDISKIMSE